MTGPDAELRHQRDDGARVDAAAQERADRHVADLVQRDGLDEQLAQLLDELVLGRALVGLELDVPVPFDPQRLVRRAAVAMRAGSSLRTPFDDARAPTASPGT